MQNTTEIVIPEVVNDYQKAMGRPTVSNGGVVLQFDTSEEKAAFQEFVDSGELETILAGIIARRAAGISFDEIREELHVH